MINEEPVSRTFHTFSIPFAFLVAACAILEGQTALNFIPVTPCRVVDTRNAAGPFGGPAITAGGTRSFSIPASACNIPQNAAAFSFNVTVIPVSQPLDFLEVWPTGIAQPLGSTLNDGVVGQALANAALVPAGTNGAINVFASSQTQLILDINGYFLLELRNADAEIPSGTENGTNLVFALANTPAAGTTPLITKNGIVCMQGADYTLSGNRITFVQAAAPQAGDLLQVWYHY